MAAVVRGDGIKAAKTHGHGLSLAVEKILEFCCGGRVVLEFRLFGHGSLKQKVDREERRVH